MNRILSKEECSLLKQIFPNLTNKQLAEDFHTSVQFMEQFGHKYGLHKNKEHISKMRSISRKGKKRKNIDMYEVEHVKNKMEWFRSFSLGDKRTGQFKSPKQCHSLSVELSLWNIAEGRERGIRLVSRRNLAMSQITLEAKPYEEYK